LAQAKVVKKEEPKKTEVAKPAVADAKQAPVKKPVVEAPKAQKIVAKAKKIDEEVVPEKVST